MVFMWLFVKGERHRGRTQKFAKKNPTSLTCETNMLNNVGFRSVLEMSNMKRETNNV